MKKPKSIRQHIDLQRLQTEPFSNWSKLSKEITTTKTFINGLKCEWISSDDTKKKTCVLFFHGGGYYGGSINTHRMLAGAISKESQVKVLLPNYHLAPESPYPSALEDSIGLYLYLLEIGYNPNHIILAGDSSGGGLSLATVLYLKNHHHPLPRAIICLSPWTDLSNSNQSHLTKATSDPVLSTINLNEATNMYANNEPLNNPYISPIHADFTDFPPIFIQVGSEEILLDDALTLAKRARSFGVQVTLDIWQGMWHVWHLTGERIPESSQAIKEIGLYIKSLFK
ncbi:MAG: alpha/beta hydrolase [Turicibacter sp.]